MTGDTKPLVLCAEDEEYLREEIVEDLERQGYRVLAAANGAEALKLLEEHKPDIILADIEMPVMRGNELLEEVRGKHPEMFSTPFIFLTSYSSRDDIIRGKQLGSDDYLPKPIDFDLLEATLAARLREVNRIRQDYDFRLAQARAQVENIISYRDVALTRLHENLHGPISAILGWSEALMSGVFGDIEDPSQLAYLDMIRGAGRELISATSDIITITQMTENSEASAEHEPCPLDALIEEALERAQYYLALRHLNIQCDIAEDVIVQADREKLVLGLFHLVFTFMRLSNDGATIFLKSLWSEEGTGLKLASSSVSAEAFTVIDSLSHITREERENGKVLSPREMAELGHSLLGFLAAHAYVRISNGKMKFDLKADEEAGSIRIEIFLPAHNAAAVA